MFEEKIILNKVEGGRETGGGSVERRREEMYEGRNQVL